MFYLDADDSELSGGDRTSAVRQLLGRCGAPLFMAVREPWTRVGRPCLSFDVEKPTRVEQEQAWRGVLDAHEDQLAERLSAQFSLDVQSISEIASRLGATGDGSLRAIEIWDACNDRVRPRLDSLAHRIKPQATWDDLVLPAEQTELLRQIAAQVTHRTKVYEKWELGRRVQRGLGIGALFAGESGTGKTLAAEVLSNHLRLNLYRIDLSSVVSKYIGETEKNLRRLFDAAEDGGCILFFDEADALFGKRTEVKDSHDRYANIEINYLLQRMEAFRGPRHSRDEHAQHARRRLRPPPAIHRQLSVSLDDGSGTHVGARVSEGRARPRSRLRTARPLRTDGRRDTERRRERGLSGRGRRGNDRDGSRAERGAIGIREARASGEPRRVRLARAGGGRAMKTDGGPYRAAGARRARFEPRDVGVLRAALEAELVGVFSGDGARKSCRDTFRGRRSRAVDRCGSREPGKSGP